jgi:hypothetical protein
MIETLLATFAAGLGLGWLAGRRPASTDKPMRLVTVHGMTAPGLAPLAGADLLQWELYVTAFAFHANLLGTFAYRPLRDAGVCRRRAWETYRGLLLGAGVLQGDEGSATTWAGGWCYSKLRTALDHGRLVLPYPTGTPPALNSAKLAARLAQASTAQRASTVGRYAQAS